MAMYLHSPGWHCDTCECVDEGFGQVEVTSDAPHEFYAGAARKDVP